MGDRGTVSNDDIYLYHVGSIALQDKAKQRKCTALHSTAQHRRAQHSIHTVSEDNGHVVMAVSPLVE